MAEAAERLGHRPGLDGLRGVAVLLVFAAHLATPGFSSGGLVGVTLFFALSGYLICTILLDELYGRGAIRLGRFYTRRALRLMPALVLAVAVWSWWDWQMGRGNVGHHAQVALLYLSDFERATGGDVGSLRHTWSLAIEEQFYLLWPVTLAVFGLRRLRPLAWVLALTAGAIMLHRTVLAFAGHLEHAEFGIDARADAIALGCLAAVLTHRRAIKVPGRVAAAAGAVIVGTTFVSGYPGPFTFGLILAALASPLLVLWAVDHRGRVVTGRLLTWCGQRSYGLYLWHVPITAEVTARTELGWAGRTAVAGSLTIACVVMSWRLVESPFLRLKDRYAAMCSHTSKLRLASVSEPSSMAQSRPMSPLLSTTHEP